VGGQKGSGTQVSEQIAKPQGDFTNNPSGIEKTPAMPYIEGHTPEWRNWQTRWTQKAILSSEKISLL
jgi:hypothetical protein